MSSKGVLSAVHDLENCRVSGMLLLCDFCTCAFRAKCCPQQQALIDSLAPTSIRLPIAQLPMSIDYSRPAPSVMLQLQDAFGIETMSCSVGNGTLPVTLRLLSPKGEELASCNDLKDFWADQYTSIRKQMRSKFPKLEWPYRLSQEPCYSEI